jgi:multiple antibiotic resistance protein
MDFSFYTVILTLVLVMDPFGNIPIFMSLLKRYSVVKRNTIIVREFSIAFLILILFIFFGSMLLGLLGIRVSALSVAGGIVLFFVAFKMLFPSLFRGEKSCDAEPLVVPLATPLVSGPATIAVVLIFTSQFPNHVLELILAVAAAVCINLLVLLSSSIIYRFLGKKGMLVIERVMGLILLTLSVQLCLHGVSSYFA